MNPFCFCFGSILRKILLIVIMIQFGLMLGLARQQAAEAEAKSKASVSSCFEQLIQRIKPGGESPSETSSLDTILAQLEEPLKNYIRENLEKTLSPITSSPMISGITQQIVDSFEGASPLLRAATIVSGLSLLLALVAINPCC
jgi:uncharacterized protein YggT (Ycf19 family)